MFYEYIVGSAKLYILPYSPPIELPTPISITQALEISTNKKD